MQTILFRYKQNYNFEAGPRLISLAACLALCLLLPAVSHGMQNDWTSPLKECWSFDTPSPSRISPASDNGKLFVTSPKGSITALDQQTGAVIWEADLGGNLWTHLRAQYKRLFTTALFGSADSGGKVVFRAINPETGVPFWNLEEEAQSPFSALMSGSGFTTMVSDDGVIMRVNQKGDIQWRRSFNTRITTNLVEIGEQTVFGTSEKTVVFLDAVQGKIVFQLNAAGNPSEIAENLKGGIYVGDSSGRIHAFNENELIPVWTAKTGAAITKIMLYQDDLIVSSNDNFVYRISSENGNKIWKRKLAGRILGSALIDTDYSVYLTTGSTIAVILSLQDGRLINKIDLGKTFVSEPVAINGGFAAPTDSKITAVTSGSCSK